MGDRILMKLDIHLFIYLFSLFLYFPQKMRSRLQYNIKKRQIITLTIKIHQILIKHLKREKKDTKTLTK